MTIISRWLIIIFLGKLEEARKLLQDAINKMEKSHTAALDSSKALIKDLKRSLAGIRSTTEYRSHGHHYMTSKYDINRATYIIHTC